MSIQACAELLQKGDPDRFLAAMAAPPEARSVLFPLWAFNLEVARAPWVTQEPMIAEMRLQWWRDALEEIASGGQVRRHEVTTPLTEVLDTEAVKQLDRLIEARRRDITGNAFESEEAFRAYLDATAGNLMWVAVRALGADERAEPYLRDFAWGTGLARYFLAIPELEAQGHQPLHDGRPEAVRALAKEGRHKMKRGAFLRYALGTAQTAPMLETWTAGSVLLRAERQPGRVADGALRLSPARERLSLLLLSNARRWTGGKRTLDDPSV